MKKMSKFFLNNPDKFAEQLIGQNVTADNNPSEIVGKVTNAWANHQDKRIHVEFLNSEGYKGVTFIKFNFDSEMGKEQKDGFTDSR